MFKRLDDLNEVRWCYFKIYTEHYSLRIPLGIFILLKRLDGLSGKVLDKRLDISGLEGFRAVTIELFVIVYEASTCIL